MGRIAVIAGQGDHPHKLAEALVKQGQNPLVILLLGQADADFDKFETAKFPVGQVRKIISTLKMHGCDRLVMAGKVTRPAMSEFKPDATAVKLLGSLIFSGDNAILDALRHHLEKEGLQVEDPEQYLPRSTLPKGYIYGDAPAGTVRRDIKLGIQALAQMDGLDIGQGLVMQAGRILSVEAAEGTDKLLSRTADFVDQGGTPAVFVKMSKQSQDKSQDAPSFGLKTLEEMAAAGIYYAAFEAEQCRALESLSEIEAKAKDLGIVIISIEYEARI